MSLLTSFDPFFRDFDRFSEGLAGRRANAPRVMPVDAYRSGDQFVLSFDLPGVDPASVEVTVEKNVLSVAAERRWTPAEGEQVVIAERPQGRFERRLYLSDNLDTNRIDAHYDHGVLSLRIPVSDAAKPRRVEVLSGDRNEAIPANSSN
jgi:HSP20 family protein